MEKEEELDTEEEKSDQINLYIRWWQLNVFLPMLHFIKPPTTFPENKVNTHNLASFWLPIFCWHKISSIFGHSKSQFSVSRITQVFIKMREYFEFDIFLMSKKFVCIF